MSDWGGSTEEDGSEEEGGNNDGPDLLSQLFDAGDKNDERGAPAAYDQDFKDLEDDILGDHVDDSDDDDFSKPKHGGRGGGKGRGRGGGRGGRRQEEEEEEDKPFMLFDFQGGADEWPDNVTLVDSQKAEELIDAAKKTIEKKSMEKKKEDGKSKKEDAKTVSYGPTLPSSGKGFWDDDIGNMEALSDDEEIAEPPKPVAPESAVFEVLKDGKTQALLLSPGQRIQLNVNDILVGGDAKKAERRRKELKARKRWGFAIKETKSKYYKQYINEYGR